MLKVRDDNQKGAFMAKDKEYLVVDLEMTCEEKRVKGYQPEIIEIGIIKVDLNGNILMKEKIIVKPKFNKISDYCSNLLGITKESVKKGIPLTEALNKLKKLGIKNKTIIAWGEDWLQFENECKWKDIENPLSKSHLNLSLMHSMIHKTSSKTSLEDAMEYYSIQKVGKMHSGVDDAYNTALIFKEMINRFNI